MSNVKYKKKSPSNINEGKKMKSLNTYISMYYMNICCKYLNEFAWFLGAESVKTVKKQNIYI